MNPTDIRMMWMSQYNPERVPLEDAQTFFGHPSVGLSVMDDIPQQPIMDLNNPMMSIVGGDFNTQAAAAAAALGVPPATLLAANTSNLYGYGTVNALQQQLLQQTAAVFQNYNEMNDDDDGTGNGVSDSGLISSDDQQQQVFNQMDDPYDDGSGTGGINGLIPKQEIINIDDFGLMNDSNSYDEAEFMAATSSDQDITQTSSIMGIPTGSDIINGSIMDEHELLVPLSGLSEQQQKILNNFHNAGITASSSPTSTSILTNNNGNNGCGNSNNSSGGGGVSSTGGNRSQRKTRKIEPVNRPGLVLKTPIAYKGNIDPSVIPIQKDGMAVCERCGAIGVKHTFYTKSRRFCSMACARGELYSLVNNKATAGGQQTTSQAQPVTILDNMDLRNANDLLQQQLQSQTLGSGQESSNDVEKTLRVNHIKNSNYRFRITDHNVNLAGTNTDLTGEHLNNNSPHNIIDNSEETSTSGATKLLSGSGGASNDVSITNQQTIKTVRLYQDAFPHDKIPQIPKYDRLPAPCPQIERVLTIKKRHIDQSHSYDWTPHLSRPEFFAAAVTCFPHAPGYEVWDNVDIDMKVEVENTDCDSQEVIQPGQTPQSFWVASILNICGYKALMRYEGFDDNSHDFWVNLCNSEVHAVGWCATRGKPLIPPRTIERKYKEWKDFLVGRLSGARTLPSSFYNKINDSLHSRFRLGLNLECVDKDRISQVRLATVTKIVGKRLFLRYFDTDDGFWCHEDSPIIHPVGWATTVGHNLSAPQDYLERMLAGREAMIEVHEDDATIELFKMNFTFEEYYGNRNNGFVEGMKLEAVDPLNLSSICAATVMAVLKFGYMMIRIDSYQPDASGADWFCYHEKSPCIFPIGFCSSNNIPLTPPNGYDDKLFTWEKYLQETGCVAAAPQLFHNIIPEHGFEVGMNLECADLMDPRLVCVATVARVVGRLLKIHFDGWTEEYDQWLDCESPDIYPVGWCCLVNHKLEGPPVPTNTQPVKIVTTKAKVQKKRKKKMPNTTQAANLVTLTATKPAKSRNLNTKLSHQKSGIKLEHKTENFNSTAYYDNSQHVTSIAEDLEDDEDDDYEEDSISHRSNQSTPVSTFNNMVSDISTAIVTSSVHLEKPTACSSKNIQKKVTSTTPVQLNINRKPTKYMPNTSVSNTKNIPRMVESHHNRTNDQVLHQQQQQQQHSLTTKLSNVVETTVASTTTIVATSTTSTSTSSASTVTQNNNDLTPDTWSILEVSQFLRANDCSVYSDTFSKNKIDGKRLMQLSKDDIINLFGMKVGPALKIYELIQQLKSRINPGGKSRLNKNNKSFL